MRKRLIAVVLAVLTLGGIVAAAGSVSAQERQEKKHEGREGGRVAMMSREGGGSFLGVYIAEVDSEVVDRLQLRAERGVLITKVAEDSPAKAAGLEEDDVILAWNGETIEGTAALRRHLAETPPGREVKLRVFRDGRNRDVSVKLGEGAGGMFSFAPRLDTGRIRERMNAIRPRMERLRIRAPSEEAYSTFMAFSERGRMGVSIQTLNDQLGAYFGLGDRSGVLITSVSKESAAEAAGLKAGDVILAIGGDDVEDPGDVMRIVGDAEEGPISVKILRAKRERTLTVELPKSEGLRWRSEDGDEHGFLFAPGVQLGPNEFRFGPFEDLSIPVLDFQFGPVLELGPMLERMRDHLIRATPGAGPASLT